jgi:hypothetical protein
MKTLLLFILISTTSALIAQVENSVSYFLYSDTSNNLNYIVEKHLERNDTIIRKSKLIQSRDSINLEKIDNLFANNSAVDTLIRINKNKINHINGKAYIDFDAPSINTPNGDLIWLNKTAYLVREFSELGVKYYEFKYINAFESHNQYSYIFENNRWINEYIFFSQDSNKKTRYLLVDEFVK